MDLRHLRYFMAVVDERHMTRAAERLGIQQPPLSQQIRALEAELGVDLFRRLPRGMAPTAAAMTLYASAQAILRQVEAAVDTARSVARGDEGRLAVGVSNSAAFSPHVPRLVRSFRALAPGVALSLEENSAEELIRGLRLERGDVVFTRSLPERDGDLSVVTLLREPMCAALPADRPIRRGAALPLAALSGERFILYRRPGGPGLYDAIVAACREAGFSPRVTAEALRLPSTLNFVAAGLGVSIVPESIRRLKVEGVRYARLAGAAGLVAPLNMVYRSGAEGAALRFVRHAGTAFSGPSIASGPDASKGAHAI